MAKKVTVTLVDDFDGSGAADETVEFGLDGVTYEIDLSTKNATKLRGDLKQWVAAGRRVGGRRYFAAFAGGEPMAARRRKRLGGFLVYLLCGSVQRRLGALRPGTDQAPQG
ncbi:iron-regulated Lsr2 protein [Mycobacterium tuberculosis]|nr:iron-regulated Lsr2 protein [Mycobacterium tuberculosis]